MGKCNFQLFLTRNFDCNCTHRQQTYRRLKSNLWVRLGHRWPRRLARGDTWTHHQCLDITFGESQKCLILCWKIQTFKMSIHLAHSCSPSTGRCVTMFQPLMALPTGGGSHRRLAPWLSLRLALDPLSWTCLPGGPCQGHKAKLQGSFTEDRGSMRGLLKIDGWKYHLSTH